MIDPDLGSPNLIEFGAPRPTDALRGSRPASFPRAVRLLKPDEFEQVFKQNERARTDHLLVMARPNALGHARLGMIIAKRLLPLAVDRNRIRRCVRETFRLQRQNLPPCDFVIRLVAKPLAGKEIHELARALLRAGQRAMLKWPASPHTE